MKKIFLCIMTLFLFNIIKAQTEDNVQGDGNIDSYDASLLVDWGDPAYTSFFSGTCNTQKSAKGSRTIIKYKQFNDWWGNEPYGINTGKLMMQWGCATTSCAMILANEGIMTPSGSELMNPGDWNKYLQAHSGYDGSNIKFEPLAIYTNNKVSNNGRIMYAGTSDNSKVAKILKELIDNGGYAVVRLTKCYLKKDGINTKLETVNSHFVAIYDYDGDGSDLQQYIVSDPGTISQDKPRKPLSDYGSDPITHNLNPKIGQIPFRLISVPKTTTSTPIANFVVWYLETNKQFDYTDLTTNSFLRFVMGSQQKSGMINCNQIWVITDPSGAKSTYTTDDFDYKFTQVGTYKISLAIENVNGFDALVKTINVVAGSTPDPGPNPPSNLDFDFSPASPTFCGQVTFTSKDHSLLGKVHWDFGDGWTEDPAGYIAHHSYCDGSGIYTVTASLISNPGISASKSISIPGAASYTCQAKIDYYGCTVVPINQAISIIDRTPDYPNTMLSLIINWGDGSRRYYTPLCEQQNGSGNCIDEAYPLNRILNHSYTTKGKKNVVARESVGQDCNKTYTRSFIVVDCNSAVNSGDFSPATYDNSGGVEHYWAGQFKLNSLAPIVNPNNLNIALTACNTITLNPGFVSEPSSGKYLILEANNTCLKGNSLKSTHEIDQGSFNLKAVPNENSVTVYPNPTSGIITIANLTDNDNIIQLYNSYGQLLYSVNNYGKEQNINLSKYSSGVYLLKIFEGNTAKNFKVIKQ